MVPHYHCTTVRIFGHSAHMRVTEGRGHECGFIIFVVNKNNPTFYTTLRDIFGASFV